MAAMNINSKKLKEMIENGKTFLVDFWAPWCPHCRKINPAYEQIAEQYAGVLEVVKVDMDEDDKLWSELQVELIPTLRLYVDGKPVASTVAPESKAVIDEFLSDILPEQIKEENDHVYDMIVIGGGPGGYTAALYAARAGFDTLVIEKLSAGGQMALTHQIDNYPGFVDGMNFISAMLFGVIFSLGWTPCVGAFLGSALMLASQQGHAVQGMLMLLAYSLGLGIPFILSAVLIDYLKSAFNWIKKNYRVINIVSGCLLVLIGILMATGTLGRLLSLLS